MRRDIERSADVSEDPPGYPEPVIETIVNCNSVEYSERNNL
jgi:hypothetical protein